MSKMTTQSFLEARKELDDWCSGVLQAKGQDYAGDEDNDRFGNFQQVADLLAMFNIGTATPEGVWAVYFLKHIFAVLSFLGNQTESEPIKGRIGDARNYLDLLWGKLSTTQEPDSQVSGVCNTESETPHLRGIACVNWRPI